MVKGVSGFVWWAFEPAVAGWGFRVQGVGFRV